MNDILDNIVKKCGGNTCRIHIFSINNASNEGTGPYPGQYWVS